MRTQGLDDSASKGRPSDELSKVEAGPLGTNDQRAASQLRKASSGCDQLSGGEAPEKRRTEGGGELCGWW